MAVTVAGQRRIRTGLRCRSVTGPGPARGKYQGGGQPRAASTARVDLDGLLGDGRPAELGQHPLPAGGAHRGGPAGVGEQLGDPGGEPGLERGGVVGVVVHEQAGAAVVDDLRDAADVAGDDGGAAGGGLEVDDAQRLVDRRDDEDRGAR